MLRFLWLTAKKETQQNKKQTPPLQLLLRQTFPTLSWQNSWPRPPPSLLLFPSPVHSSETNPLFDISPPPSLAVATAFWSATQTHAHQRKEASVFHLGEEAVVSHLDGPAVRLAGKRQRRQIQEQKCLRKKKDPYMISLLIRGEDDQGIDLAIRFPCDLAESGFFSLQLQNLENIMFRQIGTK